MWKKPFFFESGFPDEDLVRTIPPRSTTARESEFWEGGEFEPTTVLLSSDSEKGTRLCRFCSNIPAEFWTHEPAHGEGIGIDLQTWDETCAEARKGCCFCRAIMRSWLDDPPGPRLMARIGQGRGKMVKYRDAEFESRQTITSKFGTKLMGLMNMYPSPASWPGCRSRLVTEKCDLLLMQEWLENCRLNHSSCNSIATSFLPTRLLDLEAFGGVSPDLKDDIKLVHSASFKFNSHGIAAAAAAVPGYITLSHCWGPPEKRPVVTYHSNLAARMERISFADLPKTFQDTVVLTRKLGQRYLWIDSLCIIQDDEEDWAYEASKMAEVYTQSYCTIAALSAKDSSEGLRVFGEEKSSWDADSAMTFNLGVNDPYGGLSQFTFTARIFTELQDSWESYYYGDSNPLSTRAWVLQEKELSTRSIHFGSRRLLWECRELKASSALPWCNDVSWDAETDAESAWVENQPPDFALYYTKKFQWLKLCSQYSARSLTVVTDKLPALSGIAQSFQKYFPEDRYVAGTWSSHLPLALLWHQHKNHHQSRKIINHQRSKGKKEPQPYIAPSWSWTSSPCEIHYILWQLHDVCQRRTAANNTKKEPDRFRENLEVVHITAGEPKHQDPYGALKEDSGCTAAAAAAPASLELGGALVFEVDPPDLSDLQLERLAVCELSEVNEQHNPFYPPLRKDGVEVGTFTVDVQHASSGCLRDKLVCLGFYIDRERQKESVSGLVLKEEIRDGSPVYSRVGTFFGLSPSLWDDSDPRHIVLI